MFNRNSVLAAAIIFCLGVGMILGYALHPDTQIVRGPPLVKVVQAPGPFDIQQLDTYHTLIRERATGCIWSLETYRSTNTPQLIQGTTDGSRRCQSAPTDN